MSPVVEPSWPPKSPRDALLSSPSGRKRYQEVRNRQGNLLSPMKRSNTISNFRTKAHDLLQDGDDEQLDEEDDEETLQLKLAAIEARLKLKKLQQSRAKAAASSSDVEGDDGHRRPGSAVSSSARPSSRLNANRERHTTDRRGNGDAVQVPLSPAKRMPAVMEPESPRRVLLGIDKGLKGKDVSLRRPPPTSRTATRPASSLGPRDNAMSRSSDRYGSPANEGIRRTKSFSERIAESRNADKARQERAEKIQRSRNTAFQVDKVEIERFKEVAASHRPPPSSVRPQMGESFSRDDVLRSVHGSSSALRKTKTTPNLRGLDSFTSSPGLGDIKNSSQGEATTGEDGDSSQTKAADPSKYEPYSALHLSNRILPHSFLSRTLASKTVLRIPDLLKSVKAPDFDPPDVEGDYVVFGIVASKSSPKEHSKDSKKAKVTAKEIDPYDDGLNNTEKYMAITLTDLKWTIDLFLFDTAFPRYYKLSEGILIAILNPNIMPPPPNKLDTNRFSLCISSSDDTVLEIGSARDIGFCKAVRKDGKTCQSWVDARKTEFCDFHIDVQIRRTQSQRMGVNNGTGMFGPGGRSGPRTGFFGGNGGGGGGGYRFKQTSSGGGGAGRGLKPEGARYDYETQSTYYIAPAPRASNFSSGGGSAGGFFHRGGNRSTSASSLLDTDNDDPFLPAGMNGRGAENREERLRRRLADQQRERDIANKIGANKIGGGIGAEYLRARVGVENLSSSPSAPRGSSSSPLVSEKDKPSTTTTPLAKTAGGAAPTSLGIGSVRKADTIRLSPMKRAREGGDKRATAAVKKTRFITSKGIREAGRDSLGGGTTTTNNNKSYDDDDDDELDII
jgi:minichromosome maintenance protein 10